MGAKEKFAIWITDKVSSIKFFFIIVLWTIVWLGWNMIAPISLRFDPYPAFVLWLFISNMIQIFLMPLVLIGQNVQNAQTEELIKKIYDLEQKIEEHLERLDK